MKALVVKELKLVVHPATFVFLALGLMVIVPHWPYAVIMFYGVLSVFFNVLNAREAHDADFTFPLPVARTDMVRARIAVVAGIEMALVLIMLAASPLRVLLGIEGMYVGMPPNLAFLGFSLVTFALFNLVFFPVYYRDVTKVGRSFFVGCVPAVLFGLAFEVAPYASPTFSDWFVTPNIGFDGLQLGVLVVGMALFAGATVLAAGLARRTFERVDV